MYLYAYIHTYTHYFIEIKVENRRERECFFNIFVIINYTHIHENMCIYMLVNLYHSLFFSLY